MARRRPSLRILSGAVALAILAGGCGGGEVVAPTPDTVVGTVPGQTPTVTETVPAQYAHGNPAAGKAIFTSKGCTGCHTLKDAGATGTVGPNLDETKPTLGRAIDRLLNGKGAMPSFKSQLTTEQIADVAAYVVQASRQS